MTSQQLLAEIEQVWCSCLREYRDAKLRVGALVHDYLTEKARECPLVKGALVKYRGEVVKDLCRRMGVSRCRLYEIVCVAKTVELLGGGEVGQLAYSILIRFRKCVARVGENWFVRKFENVDVQALYREAVAENWTVKVADKRLSVVVVSRRAPGTRVGKATKRPRFSDSDAGVGPKTGSVNLEAVAVVASPGDFADLVVSAVRKSKDPVLLASVIRSRLDQIRDTSRGTGKAG